MKTGWVLTTTFIVTFAAGGAVGLLVQSRNDATAAVTAPQPQSDKKFHMMDQLNLNEEQRKQVSDIWHGVCEQMREVEAKRSEYEQLRDKALDALHTDEQRAEADRIKQEFDQHVQQIKDARSKAFEEAQAKTRALLNDEQRVQFDELMARRKAEYDKARGEWKNRDGSDQQTDEGESDKQPG